MCALGSKRVTAASRMSEEHIFYKNALTKKLKAKSLQLKENYGQFNIRMIYYII